MAETNGISNKKLKLMEDGDYEAEGGPSEPSIKVFNDAIHGPIELHPLCVLIIDTPQFQRLRYLKQLGSVYFVFPSASHNRFEHSIGVCYLAGQMVESLQRRQPELEITDQDVLCVKIAGLCHDLGHGPFSHLWDFFIEKARPNLSWRHENASVDMLKHLIVTNELDEKIGSFGLTGQDRLFIEEMITLTDELQNPDWILEGRPKSKSFLYEIVANKRSGVDVDKWDYLLRDSHSLGLKVMFDYKRLIKFSRVIKTPNEGLQICYRDKEENNIYDMFHTRKTLHRIAYQHKVAKIIDAMIIDALVLADEYITYTNAEGEMVPLSKVVDDPYTFSQVNDDIISKIYHFPSKNIPMNVRRAKEIIHRIYTRRLYRCAGKTTSTNKISDPQFLLSRLLNVLPDVKSDDIHILFINLNYGMGSENPINHCKFFTKSKIDIPYVMRSDSASMMLPKVFEEKIFLVLMKVEDDDLYEKLENAFIYICDDLHLKMSSIDCLATNLTPEKLAAVN